MARAGKHGRVIDQALAILSKRFADDGSTEGYRQNGSVAVARFEIDGAGEDVRELRLIRRREASDLVMLLLKAVG